MKLKITGTQSEVDAFVDSIPVDAIAETSGSLPHRHAPEVHKYLILQPSFFVTPKPIPYEQR